MKNLFILLFLGLSFISSANAALNLLQEIDSGVWRGSQPKTQKDFDQLKKMKIKVIVNIQRADDKTVPAEKALAETNGIKFIHLPMVAADTPTDEEIDAVFHEIMNGKNHPIYFHCTLGRDRTGLIAALYRVNVQGWAPSDAYKEWIDLGFASGFLKKLDAYFKKKTGLVMPAKMSCGKKISRV